VRRIQRLLGDCDFIAWQASKAVLR
jgi:hypothetical protein